MAELKPCPNPKCGSKKVELIGPCEEYNLGFGVYCNDCGYDTPLYKTEFEAISAWNKRSK